MLKKKTDGLVASNLKSTVLTIYATVPDTGLINFVWLNLTMVGRVSVNSLFQQDRLFASLGSLEKTCLYLHFCPKSFLYTVKITSVSS